MMIYDLNIKKLKTSATSVTHIKEIQCFQWFYAVTDVYSSSVTSVSFLYFFNSIRSSSCSRVFSFPSLFNNK